MELVYVSGPASEPITLAEAKAHLRVDLTDEDDLISVLITAARQYVEVAAGVCIGSQTWRQSYDCFPECFLCLKTPLVSVTSLYYLDSAGSNTLLDPSDYRVDVDSGRVTPLYGDTFPTAREDTGSVRLTYVAGGTIAPVLRQAMFLLIGHWFENREAIALGTIATNIPLAVQSLVSAGSWGKI